MKRRDHRRAERQAADRKAALYRTRLRDAIVRETSLCLAGRTDVHVDEVIAAGGRAIDAFIASASDRELAVKVVGQFTGDAMKDTSVRRTADAMYYGKGGRFPTATSPV